MILLDQAGWMIFPSNLTQLCPVCMDSVRGEIFGIFVEQIPPSQLKVGILLPDKSPLSWEFQMLPFWDAISTLKAADKCSPQRIQE